LPSKELLEHTTSVCPECFDAVPAEIHTDGKAVFMRKNCSSHGTFEGMIWSDVDLYKWSYNFTKPGTPFASPAKGVSKGCPHDCGLCPDHEQHTCLAILEVTDACNLGCPVCLSSSPDQLNLPMTQIEYSLKKFLFHEGRPSPIQLSGGEPTTRSDLRDVIQMTHDLGFKFIEVNSNGIALSKNPELAREYADAGLDGVYLQFDGLTDDIYRQIRGMDLLAVKKRAIENIRKSGLSVVLAVTLVAGVNDAQMWDIIKFAIDKGLNGVNFQPVADFGRIPKSLVNPMDRVTNSDVANGVSFQSQGVLKPKDFIPVPCPDNRCQMLSYLSVKGDSIKPISSFIDAERLLSYYSKFTDLDRMNDAVRDVREIAYEMWSSSAVPGKIKELDCFPGCCSLPISSDSESKLFPVGCHGMMDRWNQEVGRLRKCCVHELTAEGTLVPFCLYNTTTKDGHAYYRDFFKNKYYTGKPSSSHQLLQLSTAK
jgi:uncharacterized radical SAM superfamily Fe-S cluster-containing enzyme